MQAHGFPVVTWAAASLKVSPYNIAGLRAFLCDGLFQSLFDEGLLYSLHLLYVF